MFRHCETQRAEAISQFAIRRLLLWDPSTRLDNHSLRSGLPPRNDIPVFHRAGLIQFIEAMRGCDLADGAGEAAYNERVGAGAIAKVAHAMEQLTIGDACRREEDVFRRNKVVHGEDLVEVVASFTSAAQFVLIA